MVRFTSRRAEARAVAKLVRRALRLAAVSAVGRRAFQGAGRYGRRMIDVGWPSRVWQNGISPLERIIFFRNFAAMVSAGLSIHEIFSIFEEQTRPKHFRSALMAMRRRIENGERLSSAMRRYPRYFPEVLVETVVIGEVSGRLPEMMERISLDLEQDFELRRKVIGAIAYPVVILVVMLAAAAVILITVLPKIAELVYEHGARVPLPTRALLASSVFAAAHPPALGLAAAMLVASALALFRTTHGRYAAHAAVLRLPLFGPLVREYYLARFFRALHSLFASGVTLFRSVGIARMTVGNEVYRTALAAADPILLAGAPLSRALRLHPHLFPSQTTRIVEVGERTGKLDEMFGHITGYYERAIRHKTQVMVSLLEPVLIAILGIVIGGLVLSVFLPIYQISGTF